MRLDRKQYQRDAAAAIGVTVETIIHWELGQTNVTVRHYPPVMAYLGYCPVPKRDGTPSLSELVRLHRLHRDLTLAEAACEIGVDSGALSQWEQDSRRLFRTSRAKLLRFIERRKFSDEPLRRKGSPHKNKIKQSDI